MLRGDHRTHRLGGSLWRSAESEKGLRLLGGLELLLENQVLLVLLGRRWMGEVLLLEQHRSSKQTHLPR